MASGKTNYLVNAWLNQLCRATAYTVPTTLYIGLFTAEPTDSTAGTEATGGGYARQSLVSNTTNWAAASGGSISTSVAVNFGTATANLGTITGFGVFDAATAGNLLYWADLTGGSQAVNNGNTYSFASGALTISES